MAGMAGMAGLTAWLTDPPVGRLVVPGGGTIEHKGGVMRRNGLRGGVGVLALTVLSVVGGSVGASSPPGSDPGGGVVGDAVAIAAGVEWRAGAGGSYAPVAASQPVAVGDGVRTDATGFAEVAYGDGSRTRLDVDTEFEVVALTDDAGNAVTRTAVGCGSDVASGAGGGGGVGRVRGGDVAGHGDGARHGVLGVVSHRRLV